MRKALHILLILLFIPVFLVVFTVVHEVGHSLLARLLGDPNSVFYLVRIEADGKRTFGRFVNRKFEPVRAANR